MYLFVEVLDERDFDSQLVRFQNIGYIGFMLSKLNTQYKFTGMENTPNCNIGSFLLQVGYFKIPSQKILNYNSFEIKKIWRYTKNCANEMYYNRYILKI
jgi:hypothetical protein